MTNRPITPAQPGRGPGRIGAWYEVILFTGEVFRGRFKAVDTHQRAKVDHLLGFATEDGEFRDIRYGDLRGALPLNPRLRAEVLARRPELAEAVREAARQSASCGTRRGSA